MMHVLCEEYETVYAACLLITSAVLGVDFGYQPTDQGQLEYIIQIEPEAIEKLKSGEAIQVGLPPNVQRVQVFRVQVGDAELPKILPTAYEEPVNERTNEIGLMPTESPKLTAPPETTSAADTRPALGEELAQYIPRQTRTLPSGATEPSTATNTPTASNTSGSYPPIPGAEERYGGASTAGSRFSVPATQGGPYGAVQTSGTVPLGSSATQGSTATNSTAGSQYGTGSTNTTGGTTPNTSTSVGGTNWSATSQNSGTTNSTTTNQQNSGTSATNPYRFNQPASGTNQSAPDLISPSDSSNWVSNNGQTNTGSTYGNNQTNQGTGQTGGTMSPPNNNSNYTYPGTNGSQQQNNGTVPGSSVNPDNPWLTGAWNQNNQTGGNTAPYSPMPNNPNTGQQPQNNQQQPQYNNQQPPAGYNNQQPYGGNFVNNGYGQQPYYGTNPNYPYNPQAPYYQGPYAGQQPVAQVAWNQPAATPPAQQSPTTTTNASVSDTDKEKEVVEKVVEKEVETLPSWWPFLAFGFLLSFCANGYMFIISQDFQRKYQDLLEDVRDLRTMTND